MVLVSKIVFPTILLLSAVGETVDQMYLLWSAVARTEQPEPAAVLSARWLLELPP